MNHTEFWKHVSANRRIRVVAFVISCLAAMVGGVVAQEATQTHPVKTEPNKSTRWNDPEYLQWLEERSMLYQAGILARPVSGTGRAWQRHYGEPQPRAAVEGASAWVLGYPGAVIAPTGTSVIASWAKPELWDAFRGTRHRPAAYRAGQARRGDSRTRPHADRRWLVRPDLAGDRPGTRHRAGIPPHGRGRRRARRADRRRPRPAAYRHRGRLPAGPAQLQGLSRGCTRWSRFARRTGGCCLTSRGNGWRRRCRSRPRQRSWRQGYIPGLINVADAAPEARDLSGWDATGAIPGADGKVRRWVYLHYLQAGPADPELARPVDGRPESDRWRRGPHDPATSARRWCGWTRCRSSASNHGPDNSWPGTTSTRWPSRGPRCSPC